MNEDALWILGLSAAVAAVAPLALMGWMAHATGECEAYEAAHPYQDIEPRQVPAHYRYIDSDALDEGCREDVESLHRNVFQCPPSMGLEPQVGDAVTCYVEVTTDDGKMVQDRITARVAWPQETYVRARLFRKATPDKDGKLRRPGFVDIPRSAIAGVAHLTAAA